MHNVDSWLLAIGSIAGAVGSLASCVWSLLHKRGAQAASSAAQQSAIDAKNHADAAGAARRA